MSLNTSSNSQTYFAQVASTVISYTRGRTGDKLITHSCLVIKSGSGVSCTPPAAKTTTTGTTTTTHVEHDLDGAVAARPTISGMVLGLTAINWIILIPATLVWPLVGVVLYFIWRSAKRHDDVDKAQRQALLDAAAAAQQAPGSEP